MLTPLRVLMVLSVVVAGGPALAGPLNPPAGPVASTPGPEPRIAVNAVNTPGDANSVFKISQPGSYYLTGNVSGGVSQFGIEIGASGVTLDLMGFEVVGSTFSFDGIGTDNPGFSNITVMNGTVRGWGDNGIDFGTFAVSGAVIQSVKAIANAHEGIDGGDACRITGCTALLNGRNGIVGGVASLIRDCSAVSNGAGFASISQGFLVGDGSVIAGCLSQSNTSLVSGGVGDIGMGFRAGARCTIRECNADRNRGHGFRVGSDCTVTGCLSVENGSGSTVSAGIHATGSGNVIDGNSVNGSDFGVQVLASGNTIIRNRARGNGTNFSFAADNIYGPILDRRIPTTVASTPAVSGSSASSTLGSTDANANHCY